MHPLKIACLIWGLGAYPSHYRSPAVRSPSPLHQVDVDASPTLRLAAVHSGIVAHPLSRLYILSLKLKESKLQFSVYTLHFSLEMVYAALFPIGVYTEFYTAVYAVIFHRGMY
ncbi:Os08g0132700 [Oryza sativa Japonica Group]|jgi:hypothetical protein|uniref:Os08g0132700 protein n=2 Tax=Oryza sativa subsp. japonica TaxID=39947 RepID=A0A0P0XBG2_ORYSJ|nr:hypothetical protein DAI22_08g228300 [Oryza sativa Japonica Group]BAF22846.1 Os08g0132700 [Oryza sativa Japonica Group]BAT03715.1 Os08g0132700 [Oryza sativa Japonica Group]|eukprot:NP_001060932.1 Os08g0132700 [Oryza sativa Japonica Group]